MKRSWFGFLLLVALLVGSLLVTKVMVDIHKPLEDQLLGAAHCAMTSNWPEAETLFRQTQKTWKSWEHFRSCFADHNPVEEIDAAFGALEVYAQNRDVLSFAATCRSLARQIAAVGEAHQLVWWNLF